MRPQAVGAILFEGDLHDAIHPTIPKVTQKVINDFTQTSRDVSTPFYQFHNKLLAPTRSTVMSNWQLVRGKLNYLSEYTLSTVFPGIKQSEHLKWRVH